MQIWFDHVKKAMENAHEVYEYFKSNDIWSAFLYANILLYMLFCVLSILRFFTLI
jgi:hypothetical protein